MAWNSGFPSTRGSLVRYSDVGVWLKDVNNHATTIINGHCPANYTSHYGAHYTSNNGHNGSVSFRDSVSDDNNNRSVDFRHTGRVSKCGADILVRKV